MFEWWATIWHNKRLKSIGRNIEQLQELIETKNINVQEIISELESLKANLYAIVETKDKPHQSRVSNAILGVGQATSYAYKLLKQKEYTRNDIEALKGWITTIINYHQSNIIETNGQLQEA